MIEISHMTWNILSDAVLQLFCVIDFDPQIRNPFPHQWLYFLIKVFTDLASTLFKLKIEECHLD